MLSYQSVPKWGGCEVGSLHKEVHRQGLGKFFYQCRRYTYPVHSVPLGKEGSGNKINCSVPIVTSKQS